MNVAKVKLAFTTRRKNISLKVSENDPKNSLSLKLPCYKFLLIHILSNFLIFLYIFLRQKFFNSICFRNNDCEMNCVFFTKLFNIIIYFFVSQMEFKLELFLYLI